MFIVTGMHRSGTSLTARILQYAGADFGHTSTMIPPDKWNPEGYLEQRQIVQLNRRLMEGPFLRFAYVSLPSNHAIVSRSRAARADISLTIRNYSEKYIKDPRFCLTLGGWLAVAKSMHFKLIVTLRHPLSVANSIVRRNRIPSSLALHLWCEHYERLIQTLERHSDISVHYVLFSALVSGQENKREREIRRLVAFSDANFSCKVSRMSTSIRPKTEDFAWRPRSRVGIRASNLWKEVTEKIECG